ncbi:MAG TPA: mechanosensitive ion channel family protein [Leptospiraceae bacterium]|nr:mechanosensitive ion channel family protein [Leptospiraceae bacterium]HMW03541.1 mechanosensitive ion channel family protein [Leptospiraceae bacterium]HMX35556.1 mechanosensitive ion channel family protein [Leptospiraceae bacterium]HMY29538.1 mechanosensitive ion channel family protein [Leptospiraceae bacterium]HMZ64822.1 mechanosensitive ion channel family protein [Leptospiraceae bacterium]
MDLEIIHKTFYGNTILEWCIAFSIIVGALVLSKVIYWFFKHAARSLTQKTKTNIDDIIVDMMEEPVSLAIVLTGIYFGVGMLNITSGIEGFKGKVFQFLFILNIAWAIERLVNSFFENYLVPLSAKTENDLDDIVIPIVQKGVAFTIWSIGVVVGLNNAGYDVGAILAGLGIGGLAFAIAAKDTISNMFGGLTVFIDQPFSIQDRVKVKGIDGRVTDIGLRTTKLITMEGRRVTIPNSAFIDNPVENISSEPTRKIVQTLKLAHTNNYTKIEEAILILKNILDRNPKVEKESFIVSLTGIEETGFILQVIYYIIPKASKEIFDTQTEVNQEILSQFEQNWIKFAYNVLPKTT